MPGIERVSSGVRSDESFRNQFSDQCFDGFGDSSGSRHSHATFELWGFGASGFNDGVGIVTQYQNSHRHVTAPRRKRQSFRGLTPRLQPESQNIQGGIVVPVLLHLAARTTVRPVGQRHPLPMAAGGTGLGRIGRIHPPELPTGTLSTRERGKIATTPHRGCFGSDIGGSSSR